MPSKAELEQELEIVHAEYEELQKQLRATQEELAQAKGETQLVRTKAAEAGLELAPVTVDEERAQLAHVRAGIESDLEALDELRSPSGALLVPDPVESSLDIVRRNQRERAELQERNVKGNTLLSRIAGLMNMDRWDEEGGELLLAKLQRFSTLRAKLAAKVKELRAGPVPAYAGDTDRPYHQGRIDMAEWVAALLNGQTAQTGRDPNTVRRLEVTVSGHQVVLHCQPGDTVVKIREAALGVLYPHGAEPPQPVTKWCVYDESGTPVPLDCTVRELVLPTERMVITLPFGIGG